MQAVVIEEYGAAENLKTQEIATPVPGDFEILVKVKATSINPIDWKIRRGDLRLLLPKRFPRIVGGDFAGVVEAVGKSVKALKPGDSVFGMTNPLRTQFGSYAQFTIAASDAVTKKPDNLSYQQAASLPIAGLTALKALKNHMKLQSGQSVLINGASGGVGTFAVQIAKALGVKVTATCSERNVEFVKSLGADEVLDYSMHDVSKLKEKFDGIFDASATLSFRKVQRILSKTGVYVTTVPQKELIFAATIGNALSSQKAVIVMAGSGTRIPQELDELATLVTEGKVRPIIEKEVPLNEVKETQAVAEAGHNRGKIVVNVQ